MVLAALRERALASAADRSTTLGIFEWSAPDGCALDDRHAWVQANPALGHRMTEQAIASALETDPEQVFRVELLSQWVTATAPALSPATWAALADPQAQRGRPVVFALDVAPDHSTASLAVAWTRPDGVPQVMLADHRPGVEWVVDRARDVAASWGGKVVLEQTGTAAFLLGQLEQAGVPVEGVPRRFYVDACSTLDAFVTSGRLRHGNQSGLNDAVAVARWSTSGDAGSRVLSRKDPRVSPLVAAALAVHETTRAPVSRGGWIMSL